MFKAILFSYLISLFIFNAIAMDTINENIKCRCGTICPSGATFATQEDLNEAISRGGGDSRNPFVDNIYQLWHTTEDGSTIATITQIQPNIFLCCGHTADTLLKANNYFKERNYEGFGLTAKSGDTLFGGARSLEIRRYPDPKVDLAIIKLEFEQAAIPSCGFLPFATPITENSGNGFVVSCGDVSIIGQISFMEAARAVSIHSFQKEGQNLISRLSGRIPEERRKEIISIISEHSIIHPEKKGDISIEQQNAIKKIIKETALFQFPIPTETNKSIRLMSVLSDCTSGSPLIIKQEKEFKILGILYKGAFFNKAFIDRNYIVINPADADQVFYEAVFLDLTQYNGWINEQVRKFS